MNFTHTYLPLSKLQCLGGGNLSEIKIHGGESKGVLATLEEKLTTEQEEFITNMGYKIDYLNRYYTDVLEVMGFELNSWEDNYFISINKDRNALHRNNMY